MVIHRDPFGGVNHTDLIAGGMAVERSLYDVSVTHQEDTATQFAGCADRAFDFRARGFVAPHGIYGNGDHLLLFGSGFDYFAAFVLPAMGAYAMRQFGLVAVGAVGEGRLAQSVVSAAFLRARIGMSAFRIRHVVLLPLNVNIF
jgi:hypothetical protein